MNQPIFEQLKKAKDISDIISERNEIMQLLKSGCWKELDELLQKLNVKYMAETLVYNVSNPYPPASLEENARNCIKFLDTLIATKAADNSH